MATTRIDYTGDLEPKKVSTGQCFLTWTWTAIDIGFGEVGGNAPSEFHTISDSYIAYTGDLDVWVRIPEPLLGSRGHVIVSVE